jgi:hypothetical protein
MRISVGCGMVDFYYYFFFFESFGSGISQKNISQNATPSKNSAGRSDFFFAPVDSKFHALSNGTKYNPQNQKIKRRRAGDLVSPQ